MKELQNNFCSFFMHSNEQNLVNGLISKIISILNYHHNGPFFCLIPFPH